MATYLDLPYNKLGGITEKEPLNYCALHLPRSGSGGGAAEPTTSFDEARRGHWGTLSTNGPVPQRMNPQKPVLKDASFAKWEVTSLPHRCTLAEALNRIAKSNATENRVLKYKIRFKDASELTFSRGNPDQPSTLAYSNYYSPADRKVRGGSPGGPSLGESSRGHFLVDARGHTLHSKRSQKCARFPSLGTPQQGPRGTHTVAATQGPRGEMRMPNAEERKKLFNTLDPNGNGKLSLAELDRGVVMLWPHFNHKPAIMRAYKAADTNGTGLLARNEFKAFLKFLHYYNELWRRFSKVDISGDRRVSLQELKGGAASLGLTEADVEGVFSAMDSNQGGYVLFDEFAMHLAKTRFGGGLGGDRALIRRAAGNAVSYDAHSGTLSSSGSSAGSRASSSSGAYSRKMPPLALPPMEDITKVFKDLDNNGNGLLSLAELDKACVYIWPEFNHKPAIMRAYKAADTSRNGWIGRKEFGLFLKFLVQYNELWRTFQQIDRSNDRRISLSELEAALPKMKGMPTIDAVQAFKKMDVNGGGYVLFEEFCNHLTQMKMSMQGM